MVCPLNLPQRREPSGVCPQDSANGLTFAAGDRPKTDRLWLGTPNGNNRRRIDDLHHATRMTFAIPNRFAVNDYIFIVPQMDSDRRLFPLQDSDLNPPVRASSDYLRP